MKYCISFLVIIFPFFVFAQTSKNLELVSLVDIDETVNDVWGFEHSNGIEYAIMGDNNSTRIFSLEDPSNPLEVADIEGANSIWRDIKNYNDVVYVVADSGEDGLLIIDLSMISEDSVSHSFLKPEVTVGINTNEIKTCHNLFIDDDGYLYLAGCNISNRGVLIYDLNPNPYLPKYVGIADLQYSHDVYVQDDLMYSSEIFLGELGIYDVSDKSNPLLKGSTSTPNNFTHNAWSSADSKYVYTTDERGESFVGSYDITDLNDIKFLDKIKPVDSIGAIPHNTHFHENYLYTSWYTEGVRITDVARPDNMVEVGYYDTFFGPSGGFNGCWGAYPFLPSGLLLASDRQRGLFVLRPNLVRASYLEGTITEVSEDGSTTAVFGAKVKIKSEDRNEGRTDPTGVFKTGQCTPGMFDVSITHPNYFPLDTTIELSSGEVTELNIQLIKRQLYIFKANSTAEDGEPIGNTEVIIENEEQSYILKTGLTGTITENILEGDYNVFAGKWGYKQEQLSVLSLAANTQLDVELTPGYEDDFLFDFGWETFTDASSGEWVRGVPMGTIFNSLKANVDLDLPSDLGRSCYITGNAGGQAGTDDVDNGTTTLTSDWFSAEGLEAPGIHFYSWFFNAGGENIAPNDSLNVFIITPSDTQLVQTIKSVEEPGEWIKNKVELDPADQLDSLKIMFVAQDDVEDGHLVEAGIDGFKVLDFLLIPTEDIEEVSFFSAYPNPLDDQITIKSTEFLGATNIRIFNTQGQLVFKDIMESKEKNFKVSDLRAGTYFLNVEGKGFKQTIKLVKI